MIQRFFLDGIDLQRGGMRVAKAVKLAALIGADEAEARLPFADVAVPRTQIAVHLAVGLGLPPARFVQCRRFWRVVRSSMTKPRRPLLYARAKKKL